MKKVNLKVVSIEGVDNQGKIGVGKTIRGTLKWATGFY